MTLFDTHCHVDLFADPTGLVREIERRRIYTLAVTNAPSVFPATEALAQGCRYVSPALGLHPQLAAERRGELPLFFEYLSRTPYIGEIGLDQSTSRQEDWVHQRRVFDAVLDACRAAGDKVLTVHSRHSETDVIDAIGEDFPGTVILHWYSGSLRMLDRGVRSGYYFSVNPAMTKGQRFGSILRRIPHDRVLLETDGPFVSVAGRPATPPDVESVVKRIAAHWGVSAEQAGAQLSKNFAQILKNDSLTST